MKRHAASRLGLILAGLMFLGGCGTIGGMANDDYKSKVYVGLRHDADLTGDKDYGAAMIVFVILDFPFSFVLDTVCLPGTALYELFR